MNAKDDDKNNILFAMKIGGLESGLKSLDEKLKIGLDGLDVKVEKHLSAHDNDRKMQWFIVGLQVVVLIFLGYLKTTVG
jgi:hypothetical protein